MEMKRLLPILAVMGLFAIVPAAVHADVIGQQTPDGLIVPIPGTAILLASDGENPFFPFGATSDMSDAIQFPGVGATSIGAPEWVTSDGITWFLPAVDENEPNFTEPVGKWVVPGPIGPLGVTVYTILEAGSTDISDYITVDNSGAQSTISFASDPVPEPGRIVALLGMFGMVPAGLVWRMRKRA
jgi:hypothetical protein